MPVDNPVQGTFTGTGVSDEFVPSIRDVQEADEFNVTLSGFGTATVQLQRSFDDGATWIPVKEYTAAAAEVGREPEAGVRYRFECTSHTSGSIYYRLSK